MIQHITAAQALPIRQRVLWPEHPIEASRVDGDDEARHFGFVINGDLVGVGSLFTTQNGHRLRKLAVLPEHQNRGIGRALMQAALATAAQEGAETLWLDARETAARFYTELGFSPQGPVFEKSGLPYRRMVIRFD